MLDSSATLSFLLEDEFFPEALSARNLLEAGIPTYVPNLWWWETCNALLVAERRKRMVPHVIQTTLDVLQNLPVITDGQSGRRTSADAFTLARKHELTVYDAAYLELALRFDARLATLDKALARAASSAGVELLF